MASGPPGTEANGWRVIETAAGSNGAGSPDPGAEAGGWLRPGAWLTAGAWLGAGGGDTAEQPIKATAAMVARQLTIGRLTGLRGPTIAAL